MRHFLFIAAAWILPAAAAAAAAEPPRVVASIKPLHGIVAAVMGDTGAPTLLLRGAATPHAYSLRPSDARALAHADLVVWIGPALEGFLVKPLAALPAGAAVVTVQSEAGLTRYPVRTGGAFADHDHDHGHGHGHNDGDAGRIDPHLWLDPGNARAIADRVVASLAARDPDNAARYRDNAARFARTLDALDAELRRRLAPLAGIPYVVFHDAYRYFEAAYGLAPVGSVTLDADRKPGARRVRAVRQRIAALQARCVFREPQFEAAIIATLVAGTGARIGTLDPLGAALPPGGDFYPALLRGMAASLADCLAP